MSVPDNTTRSECGETRPADGATVKHSPGPFQLGGSGIFDVNGREIAVVLHCPANYRFRRGRDPRDVDYAAPGLTEAEANGTLLAAAPELLAACEAIMRAEPMQQGARDGATLGSISLAIDAARAALAKAKGGAS